MAITILSEYSNGYWPAEVGCFSESALVTGAPQYDGRTGSLHPGGG
jgi:hypothetical protein